MAIKVVVHGAAGKMGQELVNGLAREPGIQVVGAVDVKAQKATYPLPDDRGTVPYSADLGKIITECRPDVIVDFSVAKATMPMVRTAAAAHVGAVIGTTGLTNAEVDEIRRLAAANKVGIVMAPNFALGAVLMMHLAKIAAKYLDYAEITELHHHLKADAPSGTALMTAREMAKARGKPFLRPQEKAVFASRGQEAEGVTIHSVRLPGFMAHQEVIFGAAGQTLTIRHDTINRECYLPGVILAVKEVGKRDGLVYGLDVLLNL
jgi:4-hydroxy-tetrahydrodipicolinate reductase